MAAASRPVMPRPWQAGCTKISATLFGPDRRGQAHWAVPASHHAIGQHRDPHGSSGHDGGTPPPTHPVGQPPAKTAASAIASRLSRLAAHQHMRGLPADTSINAHAVMTAPRPPAAPLGQII